MESDSKSSVSETNSLASSDDVLQCWKDIAVYLQRDLRTVMRWEHSRGMPVHRLPGGPKSAVYALKSELETWRNSRDARDNCPQSPAETTLATQSGKRTPSGGRLLAVTGIAVTVAVTLLFAVTALRRHARVEQPIRSLAVLPFENLNNDPGEDYIARGVHEALITDLASTSGIRVISHTSVMRYQGTRVPASQIARELNVDALVEGSVLRIGNRVRITAQLIRADTDEHVWARSYDRELQNVLGLMADVSNAITAQIHTVVSINKNARSHAPAIPLGTVDAYLRAQFEFQTLSRDGLESALQLYRRSVKEAPQFALGWCGIAASLTAQAFFGYRPASDVLPEARNAANRALATDDNLGEAHGILGYIELYWDWDFDKAGKTLARAVELSPSSSMVRHEYADYLLITGNTGESLRQATLGELYNPNLPNAKAIRLYHALMARRYEEVITKGRELTQSMPSRPLLHDWLGRALWLTGRQDEALAEWKLSMPNSATRSGQIEATYKLNGNRAALIAMAEQAASAATQHRLEAITVASWFAAAGDADRAMQWLEVSFQNKEPFLLHVAADPFFDPVRSDLRFQLLLQKIGIRNAGNPPGNTRQDMTSFEHRVLPLSEPRQP